MDKGTSQRFAQALAAHDELLARRGHAVWVGGEPTFTERFSTAEEWTTGARGADKYERALSALAELASLCPGAAVLRTVGRQYPDEDLPRFSLGVYARRDGRALWSGPCDPGLSSGQEPAAPVDVSRFRDELKRALSQRDYHCQRFDTDTPELPQRLVFSRDPIEDIDEVRQREIARTSVHEGKTPIDGLKDPLATSGLFLVAIGHATDNALRVEIPEVQTVELFCELLKAIGTAAKDCNAASVVLTGFPPPTNADVAFTTITPDPGVLEINMAPCSSAKALFEDMQRIYRVAEKIGLYPDRLHFNGDIQDSGGGGHLTLGGPSPEGSPFLLQTKTLGRLIEYFVEHPALSYHFAGQAGSSSQAPRVDEGSREAFGELRLALSTIQRSNQTDTETLWRSFAPFLVDRFGNTHRAEINVEKLWNPYLPGRGRLGLVEFRALRMPASPERWAALAALFRSLVVLASTTTEETRALRDWGQELHDRYALPFFLRKDLCRVFQELASAGLELGSHLEDELLDDSHRMLGKATLGNVRLEVRRAMEFWPVIGDLSAHAGSSRLMDSSCMRLEICVRGKPSDLAGWTLEVDGFEIPLRWDTDALGTALVMGIRFRSFVPPMGLHPLVSEHGPVSMSFRSDAGVEHLVRLHSWRPDGGVYDGLPASQLDARKRCQDRLVVETRDVAKREEPHVLPDGALTRYCVDLRWSSTVASGVKESEA